MRTKAQRRVPRPVNAFPDEVVWEKLGISRRTFYRKLGSGKLTAPMQQRGTKRRWWSAADIEIAKQELAENPE